jgi:hypothetical protein
LVIRNPGDRLFGPEDSGAEQAGLRVPPRRPKRGRLWLADGSCIRLHPERPDHVWAYDFAEDRTHDSTFHLSQLADG